MSTTLHHLQTLVGLGPRPIALPANQAAADYIRETFCAAGLEVEEQPDKLEEVTALVKELVEIFR